MPFTIGFILLLLFLAPLLAFLINVGLIGVAFEKLGIPPGLALSFYLISLIASSVNIPIYKREVEAPKLIGYTPLDFFIGNYPQLYKEQVIAVNVGGCLIPLVFSLIVLSRTPFLPFIFALIFVTFFSYFFSKPVEGVGIVMPFWVSPIVSVISAWIFAPSGYTAQVAFTAGIIGTIIGADILHLKDFVLKKPGMLSIGGAGVFDGIYLTGIIAAFLS
ncbi:MAG: DUF1614 domain-containing protein [Actinobacteria bacterium]|nr:DUF1614 domain-containing protein [Actinomycetota bacterium]